MLVCVESNKEGSDGEMHGLVCTAFSVVHGDTKSLLLITRSNGLCKTRRSFAAQTLNRPRSVKSCAVRRRQRVTAEEPVSNLCSAIVSSGNKHCQQTCVSVRLPWACGCPGKLLQVSFFNSTER